MSYCEKRLDVLSTHCDNYGAEDDFTQAEKTKTNQRPQNRNFHYILNAQTSRCSPGWTDSHALWK